VPIAILESVWSGIRVPEPTAGILCAVSAVVVPAAVVAVSPAAAITPEPGLGFFLRVNLANGRGRGGAAGSGRAHRHTGLFPGRAEAAVVDDRLDGSIGGMVESNGLEALDLVGSGERLGQGVG
jgi:hypothetical protein